MTIYIFGNPIEPSDSLPVQLIPILKKEFPDITFIHADPTENWWQGEKEIVILDTVKGIDKVTLLKDLDAFQKQSMITPHDYDVYVDLMLMKKIREITSVTIIGIPVGYLQTNILIQCKNILTNRIIY